MKATAFDGTMWELGHVSTRRGFVRLLGGAVAMGAGLALTGGEESHAKAKRRSGAAGQVSAEGKGKKVAICYQGQTRTVKKSKLGNYPGATRGACPGGGNGSGNDGGNGGGNRGEQVACTTWIISGGPNQADPILVDDDFYIYRGSNYEAYILLDNDKMASMLPAVVFNANVGEVLRILAYDKGGCRSLSPLWLHCVATGQKRMLFSGFPSPGCNNGEGRFFDQNVTVSL